MSELVLRSQGFPPSLRGSGDITCEITRAVEKGLVPGYGCFWDRDRRDKILLRASCWSFLILKFGQKNLEVLHFHVYRFVLMAQFTLILDSLV